MLNNLENLNGDSEGFEKIVNKINEIIDKLNEIDTKVNPIVKKFTEEELREAEKQIYEILTRKKSLLYDNRYDVNCDKCGGFKMDPNKHYLYAGKLCSCEKPKGFSK